MPVNALTRKAGLKIGPVVLETLIKRYFDRVKDSQEDKEMTQLRQDELLYDAAFKVVKAFLDVGCNHTVEELQGFANMPTPSPPWVQVIRLLVPMSCCDEAAEYLIKALGGEEVARKVVGGIKWWQVRGVNGVDAQWVAARKDFRDAKKRQKTSRKSKEHRDATDANTTPADTETYQEGMDEMRCILYFHGGGYYFGSVDQERYSIQRHARKINGRVFAVNYRLAPQYPFPCAIQDAIAAYIFLIRPPPGAAHQPVNPAHIVVAGDSAGGGLSLALLQVIRDSGLPPPAGGALISPWCDLTHSFPSIHTNTATDVIPIYGLSMHKPSTLWPPPSDEMTCHVRASLRSRIRQTLRMDDNDQNSVPTVVVPVEPSSSPITESPIDVGATTHVPPIDPSYIETILLTTKSGEQLKVDKQVQLYALNSQLVHPLISPALSFLGGLPPLLIIASEKEVLRDEIIYTAHKAVNPEKYTVREEARKLYPLLEGIESRYGPTHVHLQIYDDAAHVLPVLFPFTTPAKFCYRAIATFCKYVTGMSINGILSPSLSVASAMNSTLTLQRPEGRRENTIAGVLFNRSRASTLSNIPNSNSAPITPQYTSNTVPTRKTLLRRSMSANFSRAASAIFGNGRQRPRSLKSPEIDTVTEAAPPLPNGLPSNSSGNVASPSTDSAPAAPEDRLAGDPVVYSETAEFPSWKEKMIRERVSTRGIIRPLEGESELDALHLLPDMIGALSELALRRYIEGSTKFEKKFAWAIQSIEKSRNRNLERAKKDTYGNLTQLQSFLLQDEKDFGKAHSSKSIKEGLLATAGSWGWGWAIDTKERPPPSSIVSRRDTDDARRLARIADKSVFPGEHRMSGNNLWSWVVSTLTTPPSGKSQRSPWTWKRKSLMPKREVVETL